MILITGANGQLGKEVVETCFLKGISFLASDRDHLDLQNEQQIKNLFSTYQFSSVIHCAAYTAVDKAEDEAQLCMDINFKGTKYLADICKRDNIKLVFISTDYVFDGNGDTAYEVDNLTHAQCTYGLSKQLAENYIIQNLTQYFIVRISWVFGIHGNNFVKTMLRIGKEKDIVNVVSDQIGSPTYAKDLAPLLLNIASSNHFGIYHATNEGFCSWADFAQYVFNHSNYNTKVNPILTKDFPTKAKRPSNSRLSKKSLVENGFKLLPTWQDAVDRYLKELEVENENTNN